MGSIDPTTLAVLWGGFHDAARIMGAVLRRTAYSVAVREGDDFSTAVFDAGGRLVAQGDFSPGHLGAMPFVVKHVAREFPPDTLRPGDAIVVNDPYVGSGHLPDIFLLYPLFWEGQLVAWVANGTHHVDVGGFGVGSQVAEGVTELYQEGLVIPPLKLLEADRMNADVLKFILANVRLPTRVQGDLLAQLNADRAGARRIEGLIRAYGLETTRTCMEEAMNRSEAAMRAGIRAIPDGTYRFCGMLDDFGPGTSPIVGQVAVTVAGDEVVVDFSGSSMQVEAGLNCTHNYTYAYTLCALRAVVDPHIPQNEGCTRPITLVVPEGSYFNPRRPAAVGGRQVASVRVFELVVGALSQAVPEGAMASIGDMSNPIFTGIDRTTGRRFVCYDLVIGGLGARARLDGAEALIGPHNPRNIPIEVQEAASPVRIERFELVAGTSGPGAFRGATAVRRDIRVFGDRIRMYSLAERHRFDGFGLSGGRPGARGFTLLNPGTEGQRFLHAKGSFSLEEGDCVVFQTPGGGGFGDPFDRDPERVLRDVIRGLVSLDSAYGDYGVVIDAERMVVDERATLACRNELRRPGEEGAERKGSPR